VYWDEGIKMNVKTGLIQLEADLVDWAGLKAFGVEI